MDSKYWWPTAKTPNHVQAFCRFIVDKGYRGIVITPKGNETPQQVQHPGAFDAMYADLTKYVATCAENKTPILPFHVSSCIVEPAQGKLPSLLTNCNMDVVYHRNLGFKAVWLRLAQYSNNLDRKNLNVEVETRIRQNELIPTAKQAALLQPPQPSYKQLSELFDERKMFQHIDTLHSLMKRKGYGGLFDGPVRDVPVRLALLAQFARATDLDTQEIHPFTLSTQLQAGNPQKDQTPTVRGDFMIAYSPEKGFRIKEVAITHSSTAINSHQVRKVARNEDIPNKAEVLMLSRRRQKRFKI